MVIRDQYCEKNQGEIKKILRHWQLNLHRLRPDIDITGSPERTDFRMVIEDENETLWLLENFSSALYSRKCRIIELLDRLHRSGMTGIMPYACGQKGETITAQCNSYWQLIPFISGIPLNRPGYVTEKWRGPLMARFLIALKNHTQGLQPAGRGDFFSITTYMNTLMEQIRHYNPEYVDSLIPIVSLLNTSLSPIEAHLPVRLCHGDYHPLNIIWGNTDIRRVIDWEFFGFKPEAYDAANMVGCLGMEDPGTLLGPLVESFLDTLCSESFLSPVSQKHFLDLVLAIRFGWLSEWLRKKDDEMIRLELTYMYLLLDNRKQIERAWKR